MSLALMPWVLWLCLTIGTTGGVFADDLASLREGFRAPPAWARPWTYWFWMDGNLTREGITADLEAMERAGLGGVVLMEVDVGVPRGPVRFMSPGWRRLFRHAVKEAERLSLQITLNAGPGWTGSGGPWVKPEQSMQHLVGSTLEVVGPVHFDALLPRPKRRPAFFGDGALPPELEMAKNEYYRDEFVLAFPTPKGAAVLEGIDEKALYVRAPYSSQPGVRAGFLAPADYPEPPTNEVVRREQVLELTDRRQPDGRLTWDVPSGRWTVVRLGRTSTGANTRPAPAPGLGLESDKLDRAALEAHFEAFIGTLVREVGVGPDPRNRGWTMLHIDSWEMGAQNWTGALREAFRSRRGYDPLTYLPVLTGRVVEGREVSERFLWDLRMTVQELIVENHAGHLKTLGRRHGFGLSIEPYDMTPCADLTLGAVADVPMAEFWLHGFNTSHTVLEAVSVAHTCGRPVVAAEAFTSDDSERWQAHPGTMKALGDWAFCAGVNRIVFHRYQHQPWLDRWPGMTMGPYGVHWERTQTWWDLVSAYHEYLARCQFLLQQGLPVADVCLLAAEGAPQVFRPPASATRGDPPDGLGYRFDGCAPETLLDRMSVKDGRLVLPDGMSYRVLMLPNRETMTPRLLGKIRDLTAAGAVVVGPPPRQSPSLSGFPECDHEVRRMAAELWGAGGHSAGRASNGDRRGPKHRVISIPHRGEGEDTEPYGDYAEVVRVLAGLGVPPDFEGDARLRFVHRRLGETDLYFLAHSETNWVQATGGFRVTGKVPEFWDPRTGMIRGAALYAERDGRTWVPLELEPEGSVFVVFRAVPAAPTPLVSWRGGGGEANVQSTAATVGQAPVRCWTKDGEGWLLEVRQAGRYQVRDAHGRSGVVQVEALPPPVSVAGPWEVRFQTGRGAPARRVWNELIDWATADEVGVRHFSGRASYTARFTLPAEYVSWDRRVWLDLGRVEVMAEVAVNGQNLGVLWKAPFEVEVTEAVRAGGNSLEVTIANLWPNRLIGDRSVPEERRVAWTTWNPFTAESPLLPSGLLGPVRLSVRSMMELPAERMGE